MNAKQLRNILALSREGLIRAAQDRNVPEEALAELAADAVAVKQRLAAMEAQERAEAAELERVAREKLAEATRQ